ncbi:AbrB/MazE/SpoVT family DNA-binding domain-containing protein [Deferribacterales bacterium RsTz2092]|nr:antitoxin [Deferribacterales bacterium]
MVMKKAKVFYSGNSQAVRLPKEFRFDEKEVYIKHIDKIVMLVPAENIWRNMFDSLDKFTDDFMAERSQPSVQEREEP